MDSSKTQPSTNVKVDKKCPDDVNQSRQVYRQRTYKVPSNYKPKTVMYESDPDEYDDMSEMQGF